MFTGIVEGLGRVVSLTPSAGGRKLRVAMGPLAAGLAPGASVAVDGVCLTATEIAGTDVVFDVGEETVRRSTLAEFRPARRVNVERPLTPQSPLGGHFVQGHVDGTGRVAGVAPRPGGWLMEIGASPALTEPMVPKGSVTVDGVSLTLVEVMPERFSVFLIPHTFECTTLGGKRAGDAVNVETDILGKYVWRYLGALGREGRPPTSAEAAPSSGQGGLTEGKLREQGFA